MSKSGTKWSDDELNLLQRMCSEGHPIVMMARALGRSHFSVSRMMVRRGVGHYKQRTDTTGIYVSPIRNDLIAVLNTEAKKFGVKRAVLCRVLLETIALEPTFIENLIDYS